MKYIPDDDFCATRFGAQSSRRRNNNQRPLSLVERVGCTLDSYKELLEKDVAKYGGQKWYRALDNREDHG